MIQRPIERLLLAVVAAVALSAVVLSGPRASAQSEVMVTNTQSIPADGSRAQSFSLLSTNVTAGSVYLVVGSVSGTSPGIPLDVNIHLPLNPDFYLEFTSSNQNSTILPNGFGSILSGVGQTDFVIPALASLAGLRFDHAFVVIDNLRFTGASNAVPTWISATPLQVDGLREGDEVLGPEVDLKGDVGDFVAGTPGALVTVNGRLATLDPTGSRWELSGLNLGIGPRLLTIRAQNDAGAFEQFAIDVDLVALDANNVVVDGQGMAFAALGVDGFASVELSTRRLTRFAPPAGMSRVDDLSVARGFLHVLDADVPGRFAVVSANDPATLVSGPIPVSVGPYAGISAQGDHVVIAGGAVVAIVYEVDVQGALSPMRSLVSLGLGQPDVTLTDNGTRALTSVEFQGTVNGESFGVTSLQLQPVPTVPTVQFEVGIPGAGLTSGARTPANFPLVTAEVPGPSFVVGHGAGLTFVDDVTGALGPTLAVGPLNFVAVEGSTVFGVGGQRLVEIDASGMVPVVVSNQFLLGPDRDFTGLAVDANHIVIAANEGGLLVFER